MKYSAIFTNHSTHKTVEIPDIRGYNEGHAWRLAYVYARDNNIVTYGEKYEIKVRPKGE